MALHPLLEQREVPGRSSACALQAPGAALRGQGDSGPAQSLERPRSDCRVVVVRPHLRDQVARGDDPADAQPGKPIGLRQPVGHDHAIVPALEGRRRCAAPFRSLVDLVRKHPCAAARGDPDDRVHFRAGQNGAGRDCWDCTPRSCACARNAPASSSARSGAHFRSSCRWTSLHDHPEAVRISPQICCNSAER